MLEHFKIDTFVNPYSLFQWFSHRKLALHFEKRLGQCIVHQVTGKLKKVFRSFTIYLEQQNLL